MNTAVAATSLPIPVAHKSLSAQYPRYFLSEALWPFQTLPNRVYNSRPWKGGWTMPQQNQTTDLNKQVVQRFVEECWNQGNLNKASEFLADQVRFHDPVFPNLNP